MSTINTKVGMDEDPRLQVSALEIMGADLWYVWMISAFNALSKYATESEYEEFLERFSHVLRQKVRTGDW